ncbi:MAG: hypothetical protein RXQ95_07090, partial [Vulcanisaeta sp.]
MDLVKPIAIIVALAIIVTYIVMNNVPGNIGTYINQPMEIINRVREEIMYSVFAPNIGTETGELMEVLRL